MGQPRVAGAAVDVGPCGAVDDGFGAVSGDQFRDAHRCIKVELGPGPACRAAGPGEGRVVQCGQHRPPEPAAGAGDRDTHQAGGPASGRRFSATATPPAMRVSYWRA